MLSENSDIPKDTTVFLSPHFLRKHVKCIKRQSRVVLKENVPAQSKQSAQPVLPTSTLTPLSPLSSLGARKSEKSDFVKDTVVLGKSHFVRKHAECIERKSHMVGKENVPPRKTHIAEPFVPTSTFSGKNCDMSNEKRMDGGYTKPNVTYRNMKISKPLPTITKGNHGVKNVPMHPRTIPSFSTSKGLPFAYTTGTQRIKISLSTDDKRTTEERSVHPQSSQLTFVDKGKRPIQLQSNGIGKINLIIAC
ncbi:uncharacterized protein LOC141705224 [Apium graveolens]|uniref:uncharacterized protein LOC141705224 n=1 Tax=Apium graveolens TaxID=4045 RepID=UPI003D7B0001